MKAATEALAHALREGGAPVSAHLFIPGFVYTGLARARGMTERPDGAWTPEEAVAFMLERLTAGDFYILCSDNETTRAQDERRIAWAAGDINPKTSSRTALPCRAGIRIGASASPHSCRRTGGEPREPAGLAEAVLPPDRWERPAGSLKQAPRGRRQKREPSTPSAVEDTGDADILEHGAAHRLAPRRGASRCA